MKTLPNNWVNCMLEDFLLIKMGQSPSSDSYNNEGKGIPFYQGCADFGEIYPITRKWCSRPLKIAEKNDLLISVRAPVGTMNICVEKSCIGRGLSALHGLAGIKTKFIYFLLSEAKEALLKHSTGTTFLAITSERLRHISVNLPPLAEQGRIVAKIEELFAGIDAGVENLKSVKNQIALYRQSVLKSAFDGTLTAKWREQKYFIKHYIVMEKSPFEIPHEWEWFKLSQLGNIGRGKSKHRPRNDKKLFGGKYPFIQTGEIKACKRYLKDYTETYSDFGLAQSKLWSENTLCITIAANIAETAILKMKACFPDSVVGFIKNDLISKIEYIEYYIRLIRENLDKAAPATAQKNINLQTLNEILVPVPTLAEQERIVAEIESRFERADALETAVDRALNDAEKLKQAVLKKAFSGELVPQNPDDEPASVLLDRIRAARASEQPARKRKLKR